MCFYLHRSVSSCKFLAVQGHVVFLFNSQSTLNSADWAHRGLYMILAEMSLEVQLHLSLL